ncbi:MAG TPA: hypothetical protein VFS37_02535 [Conexibacter sp.]|nr:hypothetical protein [Conexibacter sp.]
MAIEDAYELAYREAVRALEHQRAEATGLQTRAGMLLAAASISVSLLGRDAFAAGRPLAWLVVVCFALLSMCVLAVLWPHADRTFDSDPQALLAAHLRSQAPTTTALHSDLIAHLARCHSANARRLTATSRAFRVAACLVAIQMVLTLIVATVNV